MTLAGQPVTWPDGSDERQPVAEQVVEQLAQWLTVGNRDTGDVALCRLDGSELLASSSFALNTPTASGGLLSFWGGGAVTHFDGREGELSLDGEVTTWLLGADWHWGHWPDGGNARRSTAGLVVSRSSSSGGYGTGANGREGEVDSTLTGAFPWARHRFTDRLEVWGAAGYGQGDLKVTPKHPGTERKGAAIETDLNLWLLYRPVDRFRKALDLVPDGFGGRHPDKGTGLRVVVLHKVIDFEGEWANTGEGTASNGLLGNDAEETFHLIDP